MLGSANAAGATLQTTPFGSSAGPRCGECAEILDALVKERDLSIWGLGPLGVGDRGVPTGNANSVRIFAYQKDLHVSALDGLLAAFDNATISASRWAGSEHCSPGPRASLRLRQAVRGCRERPGET